MFRSAFKAERCTVPASGFYEWMTVEGEKRPFYITARDGVPLSIAELWEAREEAGEKKLSCTIVTTDANDMVPTRNRMPVIFGRFGFDA